MADINQYMFDHAELTEVLIKHLGVHEGRWVISLTINTNIGLISPNPEQVPAPGALFGVSQVGISRVPEGGHAHPALVVDAGKANPGPKTKPKGKKK